MNRIDRLVVASTNAHKIAEIETIFGAGLSGCEVVSRPDWVPEVEEVDSTLEGNASLKASAIAAATGMAALADDSGLFVDALDGAPGVRSARFGGVHGDDDANRRALISRLRVVPDASVATVAGPSSAPEVGWTASFRCAIAVCIPSAPLGVGQIVVTGRVDGWVIASERGVGGFGYDSMFVPLEGDGRTFAEMLPAEKNAISHRRRALDMWASVMSEIWRK